MVAQTRLTDPLSSKVQSAAPLVSPLHSTAARATLAPVVEQNIAAIMAARAKSERAKGCQERIADGIACFAGTHTFVYLHVVWFSLWLVCNSSIVPWTVFDPYPFGMLTTIVSLEAIFLSAFVLITQNRQSKEADRREELDLQINLLAEHEVTRLLRLTDAIAQQLGVKLESQAELRELKQDIQAGDVLDKLQEAEVKANGQAPQSTN